MSRIKQTYYGFKAFQGQKKRKAGADFSNVGKDRNEHLTTISKMFRGDSEYQLKYNEKTGEASLPRQVTEAVCSRFSTVFLCNGLNNESGYFHYPESLISAICIVNDDNNKLEMVTNKPDFALPSQDVTHRSELIHLKMGSQTVSVYTSRCGLKVSTNQETFLLGNLKEVEAAV